MSTRHRSAAPALLISLTLLLTLFCPEPLLVAAAPGPSPSMRKLYRTFVGDWSVVETFRRNQFFPTGGERKGEAHFAIGTGGTSLIEDYHSNGSAGKLDFLLVVWWDSKAQVYKVFTCSNDADGAGALRGSAQWKGDTFVNQYEETVNGKPLKFEDRFTVVSPTSVTLVAGIVRNGQTLEPLITTTYQRKERW